MSLSEKLDKIKAELLEILAELDQLDSTTTGEDLVISSELNRQAATTRDMDEYHPLYPASMMILNYDDLYMQNA